MSAPISETHTTSARPTAPPIPAFPPDTTLAGPNILLAGPAGTGKTRSIATLVETGIEVFYLDLENGLESLLGYWADSGKPIPPNLRWHKVSPATRTWDTLRQNAVKINTWDEKSLANWLDPDRNKHNLFIKIIETMAAFPDDRTGQVAPAVDSWPPGRALIIDGLTGLSNAAMSMVVGGKPMRSQGEWGRAMDQLEIFLRMLCDQCRCWFVLISHVEREIDEVLGGAKIMPSTLGRKLAPKIAPMFSDVILTVREGTTWTWDTTNSQADLKARNLPWKNGQPPTFRPLIETWARRAAAAAASASAPALPR